MLDKSRKTETEVSPKDRKRPGLKSEVERRVGGQNQVGTDAQHVSVEDGNAVCIFRCFHTEHRDFYFGLG